MTLKPSQTHNLNQSNHEQLLKTVQKGFRSDSIEEPFFGSPKNRSVNSKNNVKNLFHYK